MGLGCRETHPMMPLRYIDMFVLLRPGASWGTFRKTASSTAASCDGDFARGFLSLAVKRGNLQRWWHITASSHSLFICCFCLSAMW